MYVFPQLKYTTFTKPSLYLCTEHCFQYNLNWKKDFPDGSVGEESTCSAGDTGDSGLIPGSGRSPWRKKWQPISVFSSGESHEQRSLVSYSPQCCKESDTAEHKHKLKDKNIEKIDLDWFSLRICIYVFK